MPQFVLLTPQNESLPFAQRIEAALQRAYGPESVRRTLQAEPASPESLSTPVLLLIIGPQGLAADADPTGPLYEAIEEALAQPHYQLIPLLVDGATLPSAESLPPALRPLTQQAATSLRNDPHFDGDLERFISRWQQPHSRAGVIAAVVVALLVAAAVLYGLLNRPGAPPQENLPSAILTDMAALAQAEASEALGEEAAVTASPSPVVTLLPATDIAVSTAEYTPNATEIIWFPNELGRSLATRIFRNSQWTPVMRNFNGMEMMLVPAGCFMMGSDDGPMDEQPTHHRCLDEPFWIARYEVSNRQYGVAGCTRYSSDPDQPRNCITWFDAREFCQANGGRLPSEIEWEYAARGPDALTYPWGNNFVPDNAVYEENSGDVAAPIGSKPEGVSWIGALDMSGNLWEWTSSLYRPYPGAPPVPPGEVDEVLRVLRGGSFGGRPDLLRASTRFGYAAEDSYDHFGIRCVRDYDTST